MNNWPEWQKTYRYGTLVILPPKHIREAIDKLRHQYDPASQIICGAHITLTQPFLNQPSDNDLEQLEIIASGYKSFSIQFGPLNNFLPYPCIYYEIHPADKILEIRHAMHGTGMFNLSLPHTEDFVPHLSITDGHPDPTLTQEIFDELSQTTSGGSFECSEISLIVPNQSFYFESVRTLRLRF